MENLVSKVKWYVTNIPVGTFLLFIFASVCFYVAQSKEIPATVVCLQPQRVISGEGALRIFKHVFFHKNFETLSMTWVLLGLFGSITERVIGTIRFLYIFLILTITSAVLTVLVAIGLAFTTHFAAVMYSCPGLGMTAPLLGMSVILFKNMPMKRTVILFFTLRTFLIPWCLLFLVYVVVPDVNFANIACGVVSGTMYAYWFTSCCSLPITCLAQSDNMCMQVFQWLPCIKYIRSISKQLPLHRQDIAMANGSASGRVPPPPPNIYPSQAGGGNAVSPSSAKTAESDRLPSPQYTHAPSKTTVSTPTGR